MVNKKTRKIVEEWVWKTNLLQFLTCDIPPAVACVEPSLHLPGFDEGATQQLCLYSGDLEDRVSQHPNWFRCHKN